MKTTDDRQAMTDGERKVVARRLEQSRQAVTRGARFGARSADKRCTSA